MVTPPNLHNANMLASFQKLTYKNVPEHVDPTWLPVIQGELPSWLNGTMYRVGGGRFVLGDGQHKKGKKTSGAPYIIRHAFDGLPYLYRFEFNAQKNSVRFNSRYIAKDYEKNLLERHGRGAMWFGESRKMSTWERLKDFASRFDQLVLRRNEATPSSVSVGIATAPNFPLPASWHSSNGGDKPALVTKSDHNALQQLDHTTLEPQKIFTYRDYDKRLDGQLAAAHHHYDYASQETINMTMSVGSTKPTLQIFSINSKGHTSILASIQHGLDADKTPVRPFYYHSFFTTENYVVVPMCPMYYKNNGVDLLLNGSVLGGVEWEPDTPTYFHIVDRHHGKGHVATLVGPSYFAFHVINARDYQDKENGSIRFELDCAAYDGKMIYETHAFGDIIRTSDYHSKYLPNKLAPTQKHNGIDYPALHCNRFGDYRRYHLTWNPSSSVSPTTHYETILTNFDFPRIHSAYTSKAHRYAYGCQILAPTPDRGEQYCLVKIDLNTKEWIRFQHQDEYQNGYLCSEPIFVARPRQEEQEQEPQNEDDGVVLSLVNVFDNRGASYDYCYLLVLDAASFIQLAYVPIGSFIAPTFHGSYDAEYSFKLGSFN